MERLLEALTAIQFLIHLSNIILITTGFTYA